ncbi:Mlp family lipoprotein [Borreliella bavariensis]|nr:Mlp family lipoprotein [Borreliella bavariensis]
MKALNLQFFAALNKDGEFNIFLQHNESKIKTAPNYVKTQFDKCNGKEEC